MARRPPRLKKDLLWGGSVWTSVFYANTGGAIIEQRYNKAIYAEPREGLDEYRKVYESQPELDFGGLAKI